jgi:phage gp36-like protein
MAYSTQSDLNRFYTDAELRQLTDDENRGNINSDRVSNAITQADSLINSYSRAQHTISSWTGSDIPPLIKELSISLASYFLWTRRRKGQIDEQMEARYKADLVTLKMINKGDIKLNDSNSFANTGEIISTNKASTDRVYTSTELDKY